MAFLQYLIHYYIRANMAGSKNKVEHNSGKHYSANNLRFGKALGREGRSNQEISFGKLLLVAYN